LTRDPQGGWSSVCKDKPLRKLCKLRGEAILNAETGSSAYAVVEMNDAVRETALVEQLKLGADVVRQGAFAATNHDRA
jgi:hypothetical protein